MTVDIRVASIIPVLVPLGILVAAAWILRRLGIRELSETLSLVVMTLFSLVAGVAGVIQVLRREAPAGASVATGTCAVLSGAILALFFWGIAVVGIVLSITSR